MSKKALAVLVFFCVSAAVPSFGAEVPRGKSQETSPVKMMRAKEPRTPSDEVNFTVDATAKYLDLESKTRFIAGNANQINYVTGGEKAFAEKLGQGEGVEMKKVGFILNLLPVLNPNDPSKVAMQVQVELSGPTKGIQVAGNAVPDLSTWQWQSSFTLTLGKKTVLVEGPAYFEMTVSRAD